jgi:hypothetical protein
MPEGLLSEPEQNGGRCVVDYLTPMFEDVMQISGRCVGGHLMDSIGQS